MSDPLSPKSPRKGKIVNLRILFLDDTLHAFQVPVKAVGSALWEAVVKHLQLLEADYFDLQYVDSHDLQCWLDREKPILKQIPSSETPLRFCIKFYTPDPGLLEDEYTRYLFALQIKRDLATGDMPCTENTAVLLASYVAQAEIGDCPVDDYTDHTYLSGFKFVPHQTMDLEKKIMEYHRQHVGESPAESDLNLLDTARKVECYGVKIQSAKDHEAVPLNLAVAHVGVLVFQNSTKINTFSWAKVRKLSFKRKKFLIKLHPENYGYYKDTVEFFFESRNECKCFWKKCIEHHAFFRCHSVKKLPRNKTRVVSRGSSFRYSGRTQKQLIEHLRETFVKRPPFERTVSGRISSRSTSVTPKIHPKTAIHNSSDLHNSTASSGSHTLERTHGSQQLSNRVETAEVHSDSSMSGSRSLGSPKLERDRSQDETRLEGTVDTGDEIDEGGTSEKAEIRNGIVSDIDKSTEQQGMSANQNANDNDDNISQASYHLEDTDDPGMSNLKAEIESEKNVEKQSSAAEISISGYAESNSSRPNSDSVQTTVKIDAALDNTINVDSKSSVDGEKPNVENINLCPNILSSDAQKASLDKKTDTLPCKDTNVNRPLIDSQNLSLPLKSNTVKLSNTKTLISDRHSSHVDKPSILSINKLNNDVPPSQCVTASAGLNISQAKLVNGSIAADAAPHGILKKTKKEPSYEPVADLIDDIPYYLHRRHIELETNFEEKSELYSGLVNSLNRGDASKRRSRSPGRRRPGNIKIEHLRFSDPLPQSSNYKESKSPEITTDRSLSGRMTPTGKSPVRSPNDRSPSSHRLVNFHKLPPKDSFSCVDDTMNQSEGKRIPPQNRSRSKDDNSDKFKKLQELTKSNSCSSVSSSVSKVKNNESSQKEAKQIKNGEQVSENMKQTVTNGQKRMNEKQLGNKDGGSRRKSDSFAHPVNKTESKQFLRKVSEGDADINNVSSFKAPVLDKPCSRKIIDENEKCMPNESNYVEGDPQKSEKSQDSGDENLAKNVKTMQHSELKEKCNFHSKNSARKDERIEERLVCRRLSKKDTGRVESALTFELGLTPISDNTVIDLPSPAAALILSDIKNYATQQDRSSMTFSTFKPPEPQFVPGSIVGRGEVSIGVTVNTSTTENAQIEELEVGRDPTLTVLSACDNGQSSSSQTQQKRVSFHESEQSDSPNLPVIANHLNEVHFGQGSIISSERDLLEVLEDLPENRGLYESDSTDSSSSGSSSDSSTSDDDIHRATEFYQFAKSLADSGKELTTDSGMGMDLGESVLINRDVSLDPLDKLEQLGDMSLVGEIHEKTLDMDVHVFSSFSNGSSSSDSSDEETVVTEKRPSADPLEGLEQLHVAEVEHLSEESEPEQISPVTPPKQIPAISVSACSSPEISFS